VKRSLARSLTYNWRLKLSALALAVLIWAVVSAEQVTSQWVPVRVDPVVRDPEFVVTAPAEPAVVSVQVTGPGRELWELAINRPTLVLSVRDVGDRRTFGLDPSMVRIPQGLAVRVSDVRPSVVTLALERLTSRMVAVRARIAGRSTQRYAVGEDLVILPAEVRVTGPADRLAALEALTTRSFDVVPDDSTFSHEVALDTAALDGLSFARTRVRVSGTVDRRVERTVGPIRVSAPEGLQARPAEVTVRLSGPERALRRVFPGALRAVVSRDSVPTALPPAGADARVVVEGLPAGVTATAVPERVRVLPPGAAPSPATPADPAPAAQAPR
jgi:YbbR domain-containing protein